MVIIMNRTNDKSLHIVSIIIIILGIVTSSAGLLYKTAGKAFNYVNQYGDTVKIYGQGLYAHDSILKASGFRGTDFTIIFIVVPLLVITLVLDIKKKSLKSRMALTSVISVFTYYSASIAFGVTYNGLQLIYIALFSFSLFGLITAIAGIDTKKLEESIKGTIPYRGIYIFLVLTGIALIAAWLPDIIGPLAAGRSLQLIEVYTTEITYVLDMGVVGPAAFICLYKLKKRRGTGYILLNMLLTLCIIVGIMLPVQTVFQLSAGIRLTAQSAATKIGSFVVLALFALYFDIKLYKSMD